MIEFTLIHPRASYEMLGYIPSFFSLEDPRPAREQIAQKYVSGWSPFVGFKIGQEAKTLLYPGDPPMLLLAEAKLREETLRFYTGEWLSITKPDGSVEIARVD